MKAVEKPMNKLLRQSRLNIGFYFSEVSCEQLQKTAKNDVIDYGTESRTSNFAEQVYRGMQSLCAKGAGSGERSARVKGQSPWQVKGGSHCPVKRRFVT